MKTTFKFFAAIAVCMFFASCENETVQPEAPQVVNSAPTKGDVKRPEALRMNAGETDKTETTPVVKSTAGIAPGNHSPLMKKKDLL